MTILGAHELGHWFACRRHRLAATPPYFLPAPVGLGTLGAFIRIRDRIRTKSQLLDVGVSGPIAGFVVLVPFLVHGLATATVSAPAELGAAGGGVEFGENLLFKLVAALVLGDASSGAWIELNPTLLGAWVGMLATMLNLLPLAQLDGGHVLYAASGRRHRAFAWPLWCGLLLLGWAWRGWWLWCVLVLLLGLRHPAVTDEASPLGRRDRGWIAVALVLFVLCFMPVPLRFLD